MMLLGGDWWAFMAIWSSTGVVVPASGERIASIFARMYFVPWRANIDSFRRDQAGGSFRGWLRTITRNKVVDHVRRQKRQPVAPGGSDARERFLAIPDGDASSVPEASDQEKAILVNQTLDLIRPEFEDRTWQAFWRATVEGQPSGVVAEALEMTPGAVRQAKSRVLRRLREELNQLLEPGGCSLEEIRRQLELMQQGVMTTGLVRRLPQQQGGSRKSCDTSER